MNTNRTYGSDRHPDLKSDQITNEYHKDDQPNPADPKPGIEKPEIEIPDFDTDGAITKSDLIIDDIYMQNLSTNEVPEQ